MPPPPWPPRPLSRRTPPTRRPPRKPPPRLPPTPLPPPALPATPLPRPLRVDRIGRLIGVRPKAVLIRRQRTRWASCGPDGTLRFNWRAIMAPPAILDYIVAHELAHLRVRAHNAEYWGVVAQAIPDYRLRRQRLRTLGAALDIG